jgi:hypothetical protein
MTDQISQRGKEYLETAQTLLRAAKTMTDSAIAGQLKALADDYQRRAEKASMVMRMDEFPDCTARFRDWVWDEQSLLACNACSIHRHAVDFYNRSPRAHDHQHPELNSWYESLSSGKRPCCDGSDAERVDGADWETKDDACCREAWADRERKAISSSRPLAPARSMPCVASHKEAPNDNWKME